ncbi:conserved hypothetical protein [Gloeothece citriformis PCC 7424]|uniref:Uncharacterized protein n=1 Tax=Gloeothece citriformis (strain PCC 7424) TaxID=65393 RepID=B7KAX4_GLOC7|nr:hypothetical protein [Gloeothece citriformis]ACK70084.1 conserved hypothetical protein [Gloeothece citriformis PCC 7424]
MKTNYLPPILFGVLLTSTCLDFQLNTAIAQTVEGALTEEEFRKLPSWGGQNWPASKILQIKDSLVDAPVGRIVVDKHGEQECSGLICFKNPFLGPFPGRSVFISLWGSKVEGCFAEIILQQAPQRSLNIQNMIPTQLDIGVGDKIVSLPVQKETEPEGATINYQYTQNQTTYSSTWYTVRQYFVVDETAAKVLSNAPTEKLKARIRLNNKDSIIFPIGVETVKRWKQAYSFNPLCSPN